MRLWNRNRSDKSPGTTSIIDEGCELTGQVAFCGTLVLNGRFKGEIHSSDTLLVGETGELVADVRVGTAVISGQLHGNVTASERVELYPPARVVGDIETPRLVLEAGVVFDGLCSMKGEQLPVVEKVPSRQQAHG